MNLNLLNMIVLLTNKNVKYYNLPFINKTETFINNNDFYEISSNLVSNK